jgi:hypothetical protein
MRRISALAVGAILLVVTAFVVPATAVAPIRTGDTVNYVYANVSGPDSSTCGGSWANDTETRIFEVFKEQAINGAYQVTEVFHGGKFVTAAGASPESCEAGTSKTLASGLKGVFHGYETLIVSNASISGNWNPSTQVTCSMTCTTAEWISHAFGSSATFVTANDWWFSYTASNALLCAHHWINASYGNSGDIASSC